MSFLDAIACVISRTTHALDVITSISRYDRRSNLLHLFYTNVRCNNQVTTSDDNKRFGLVYIGQWGIEANKTGNTLRCVRITIIAVVKQYHIF